MNYPKSFPTALVQAAQEYQCKASNRHAFGVVLATALCSPVEERLSGPSIESFVRDHASADCSRGKAVASAAKSVRFGNILLRKRGDKWFFTSLIAAPVPYLLALKTLVWEQSRNAEGEKEKPRCASSVRRMPLVCRNPVRFYLQSPAKIERRANLRSRDNPMNANGWVTYDLFASPGTRPSGRRNTRRVGFLNMTRRCLAG